MSSSVLLPPTIYKSPSPPPSSFPNPTPAPHQPSHIHLQPMQDPNKRNMEALRFIEEATSNAGEIQSSILKQILSINAGAEYLKLHGFSGPPDPTLFKKIMPVVTYEDLQPYIQRIAEGDSSKILCTPPVSEFLTSSGTSGGERKLMPTIEEDMGRRSLIYSLLMPVISQFVEGVDKGKGMYFLFVKTETITPGGLLARPVLTSYYKSSHFRGRSLDPYTNYTSPDEAILCPDSYQSMYTQLLCGLLYRDQVVRVGAVFASGFIRAIVFFQTHWRLLCEDIRKGTLDPSVTDACVREAVMKILEARPEVADVVERECSGGVWGGIIRRIWPWARYIEVIVTGTMSQYVERLEYYGDGLPLVSTMYASSECYFGLNLEPLSKPEQVSYTLIPTMAFFEFIPLPIPLHGDHQHGRLVDLVDVRPGCDYELVITTFAGLYRYRVGDVLRVAGFKNQAPQFKFVRRENVVLSIDSEKTDEAELQEAVRRAGGGLAAYGASVVEYTSRAETRGVPGHYVLYWEMVESNGEKGGGASGVPTSVMEECCLQVEESLNSVYRQGRVCDGSIGALEIKVVEEGTFEKVMDNALAQGASINQYKTPRCVKCREVVELLESRVRAAYRSPRCPQWVPGQKQWRNHPGETAVEIVHPSPPCGY